MKQVSHIGKTLSDAVAKNKTGLINPNQLGDKGLQSSCENFRDAFDGGILKSNWSEVLSFPSTVFLGEEDKL